MAGEDVLADAYRAPVADLDDNRSDVRAERWETDYVVSSMKLGLLFVATLGVYGVYWFYKHWQHQKRLGASSIWPHRARFSRFFT